MAELRGAGRLVVDLGVPILVLYDDSEVIAVQALCPHRGAPLNDGFRIGNFLVCSWHGSTFQLSNGQVAGGPAVCTLAVYQASIDGEDLLIDYPVLQSDVD